jgi:hypothetical protein
MDAFAGDGTDRRLLFALAQFADRDGRSFPGLESLAKRAGLGKATVARRLPSVERTGWVARVETGGGSGKKTVYQLRIPETETVAQAELSHHGTETVSLMDETVAQAELSHHGTETVSPRSGKLSHGHAQRTSLTDLNRKNRETSAELARSADSASSDSESAQPIRAKVHRIGAAELLEAKPATHWEREGITRAEYMARQRAGIEAAANGGDDSADAPEPPGPPPHGQDDADPFDVIDAVFAEGGST